jgi:hypothetical protein
MEFGNYGLIELEDAETGEVVVIDSASRQFRESFAAQAEDMNAGLKRSLKLIDLDFIQIRTDRSYIVPLIQFFKMREKRH